MGDKSGISRGKVGFNSGEAILKKIPFAHYGREQIPFKPIRIQGINSRIKSCVK